MATDDKTPDTPDIEPTDEVENGFVLACQSRPLTDEVVLDFDA